MAPLTMAKLSLRSLVLSWAAIATAQLNPSPMNSSNSTINLSDQQDVRLTLDFQTTDGPRYWPRYLLNINTTNVPLKDAVQGVSQLIDDTNTNDTNANGAQNIAIVSCDPPQGFLTAQSVLSQVIDRNPLAIILYSNFSDYCNVTGSSNYANIYSMLNVTDSSDIQTIVNTYSGSDMTHVWAYIQPMDVANVTADHGNGTTSGGGGSGGAPTTAIAMIILYTITGVITVLFLIVIVTGAIRAHRHPERYGLRAAAGGRPRRSRAHGLARAMLDSLPIVKFGERDDNAAAKPAEVELGNRSATSHGPVEMLATPPLNDDSLPSTDSTDAAPKSAAPHLNPSLATPSEEQPGGIAPAAAHAPSTSSPTEDTSQGCSICTEDFERGQDQRVLPCNHKFHPACIDPWLLNVSATCPLCRIDLQPRRGSDASLDGEENNTNRNSLAPPMDLQDGNTERDTRRSNLRRSFVASMMGLGSGRNPEDLSREERVAGLREVRARRTQVRERDGVDVGATVEEEGRIRGRLRGLIGRRRGREEGDS